MKKFSRALLAVLCLGLVIPGAVDIARAQDVVFGLPGEIWLDYEVRLRGELVRVAEGGANFSMVPEPSTWMLLGLAIGGAVVMALRRKVVDGKRRPGKREDH